MFGLLHGHLLRAEAMDLGGVLSKEDAPWMTAVWELKGGSRVKERRWVHYRNNAAEEGRKGQALQARSCGIPAVSSRLARQCRAGSWGWHFVAKEYMGRGGSG